MRRSVAAASAAALVLAVAPLAAAAVDPPGQASGASPLGTTCHGAPQSGTLFHGSEVEPWVDVDPTDPSRLVGVYQQDRFSNGGASGQGVSVSDDGGATWRVLPVSAWPKFSRCQGAAAGSSGDYERATDPWVSFGPDGDAYQITLAFNDTRNFANAILVSESTDGGDTWGPVTEVRVDTNPHVFNDKESITADWTSENHVYAIWDRLVFPNERARGQSFLTAAAFRGPAWFARTTDGGATWEAARPIFDPGQNDQTIGNQIAVLPDGDLVNVMTVFRNDNKTKRMFGFVSVLRSTDKGATWSGEIPVDRLGTVGVTDPATGAAVRTGDIIPDIATDRRSGTDNVYVVWQDARFTGFARDQIAFSKSTDGGRTWSAPVRINSTRTTQAFTASVEVDAAGNLGVTHYDFRNDDLGTPALETDLWFLRSTDGGASWSEERVTPASFDMRAAPVARGFFVGDYEGLAATGQIFKPFWSQSLPSGTDTFGATVRAPFTAPTIVPDPSEAAGVRARDFPAQQGKPTPH
ncbi:MAG TPA: sialidase family protein [Actinomycetes bacterium]|nr:sialidase family protein [Actinomycetes bacterium]